MLKDDEAAFIWFITFFFTITCSLGGEMKVIAIHNSMIFFGNVSRSKLESLQVIEDSWKRVGNTVISAHRYHRYIWLTFYSEFIMCYTGLLKKCL